ncbi:MAG: guanylate kinase [Clostridia bacterium]|nr:guanylate kinase [Clostridia bacterium]
MKANRGLLVVFSGPSGSGKGTVLKDAMSKNENLELSVSATTRLPRQGEQDGISYYFLDKDTFIKKRDENGFLEWAEFCDNFYGTPADKVEDRLNAGKDVVLEIEVQGAMKVKERFPEAVLIFNMPPSMEELKLRLIGRQTESEDVINNRLKTAEWEISMADKYDHIIVNDEVEKAALALISIINEEKNKNLR